MKEQQYSNHKMYYIPHHLIFLPMTFIFMLLGVYKYFFASQPQIAWLLFGISSFCTLYLALMLRQHYALGNQNRIVRLEFRLRYFEITGKRSTVIEDKLSFGQIAALRFASDDEFVHLLNKAIEGNTSPDEIKKAIKQWNADLMRV